MIITWDAEAGGSQVQAQADGVVRPFVMVCVLVWSWGDGLSKVAEAVFVVGLFSSAGMGGASTVQGREGDFCLLSFCSCCLWPP